LGSPLNFLFFDLTLKQARPQVTVYSATGEAAGTAALPAVLKAPIRTDVVQFVHTNMAKNKRQAYAVYKETGKWHARPVSRSFHACQPCIDCLALLLRKLFSLRRSQRVRLVLDGTVLR
jgi:hypothetical protein